MRKLHMISNMPKYDWIMPEWTVVAMVGFRICLIKVSQGFEHVYEYSLKLGSHLPKVFIIICFNDSPSKMIKNAFYFIFKTLFVLKIFKFLPKHVEKTAWLERWD